MGILFLRIVQKLKNLNKINLGFFGRNMKYKNVFKFVSLSKAFPKYNFFIVGKGYDDLKNTKNLFIINKFLNNDNYYSYMQDMDYIVVPYKKISFSGIISDIIFMKKKLLTSNFTF